MRVIQDKIILLFCGGALLFFYPLSMYSVVAFLIGVTVSALGSVLSRREFCALYGVVYGVLCFVQPEFCLFLPLVVYDIFTFYNPFFCAMALLPVVFAEDAFTKGILRTVLVLLFLGFSYRLYQSTARIHRLHEELLHMRDSGKELELLLESKNDDLMEKQDYEIRLATMGERNRIAREIHDNVGHMLSRSILQVGALMAINKEEGSSASLRGLQDTLSQAMDSIRRSVHDLHDESIDLNIQVQSLIREFTFCPVHLDYDVDGTMAKELKYTLLSIIKEALSNIVRHSKATRVTITLREHPALYQLIIQDNGCGIQEESGRGMGLQNMADRVAAFHGNLHIDSKTGCKIFISIPKGERAA